MNAISISRLQRTFLSHRPRGIKNFSRRLRAEDRIIACNDITLNVNAGELLGLAGPNGSGKTTLLKILSTIILPDSGRVLVNGYDVVRDGMKARACVRLVTSENSNFYVRLTGRQNMEFYGSLFGLSRREAGRKIEELADLLGITRELDRMFQEYSSGIRQRYALARGFLTDTPILLLDEPTKNLDPLMAQKISRYVREALVKKQKKTVLWTSHVLLEIAPVADTLVILKDGQVKACGSLQTLGGVMGQANAGIDAIYKHFVSDSDSDHKGAAR